MNEIEYCDLNIMSSNRILLTVYYQPFISKYILRDFNDQILKGSTAFDFIQSRAINIFGYKFVGGRRTICVPDFVQFDFQVKKIIYNP